MAIYRAESSRRIALVGGVAVVVGLVVGLVVGIGIGRMTAPGLGAQVDDLVAQVAPIRSSLEVVRTEYPKLLAGGADAGGAAATMTKISTTWAAAKPAVTRFDPSGAEDLAASIDDLKAAIEAKDPQDEVEDALDSVADALDGVLPPPVPSGE